MHKPLIILSNLVEIILLPGIERPYGVINHSSELIKYSPDPLHTLPAGHWKEVEMDELVLIASVPELNFQFSNGHISMNRQHDGSISYTFQPNPDFD